MHLDTKRNKELLNVAFPHNDHGLSWMCSLRNNEHDVINDGIKELQD